MSFRKAMWRVACGVTLLAGLYALQRPFRQYPGVEYRSFELTPDWEEKTEWGFARVIVPPGPNDRHRARIDGDWRNGLSLWTQDFQRAYRHFSQHLRRLTPSHMRTVS